MGKRKTVEENYMFKNYFLFKYIHDFFLIQQKNLCLEIKKRNNNQNFNKLERLKWKKSRLFILIATIFKLLVYQIIDILF